jgi:tRNA (guanine26-N2/guanine27-N2)-dimethyltransferase
VFEKVHESGAMSLNVKLQSGPPVGEKCPECDSILHVKLQLNRFNQHTNPMQVAGPMWSAPIHDPDFIGKVLEHLEINPTRYGTAARMKGMLTVAKEVDTTFSV